MAVSIDATYGSTAANCYISHADANTWIRDNVLFAEAWERVHGVGGKQELALLRATRLIDSAATWLGSRYFWNQLLEFPRVRRHLDFLDEGYRGAASYPLAGFDDIVANDEYLRQQKLRVQHACCEQAVYILTEGRDTALEDQFKGITSRSLGHRFSDSESYGRPHLVLCPDAWLHLAPYEGDPVIRRGGPGKAPYLPVT